MGINLGIWEMDDRLGQSGVVAKMNEANRAKPWGEPHKGYTGPSKTEFMEAGDDAVKTAALLSAGEAARIKRRDSR